MLSAVFLAAHAVCAIPLALELSAVFLGASGFSSPSSLKPPRSSRTDPISPSPQPSPSSSFPHRRTTLAIEPSYFQPSPALDSFSSPTGRRSTTDRILSLSAFSSSLPNQYDTNNSTIWSRDTMTDASSGSRPDTPLLPIDPDEDVLMGGEQTREREVQIVQQVRVALRSR